jgi:protein TonB
MGSSARVALSAALAVPVAVALFLIMFKLIDRDYEQDDSKARKIADIVVPDKTIETNLKEVKPEKVDDPEEPPPDLEPIQFDTQLDMNVANTAPVTGINLNLNASGMSSGDGEYLPIVKVAPDLPATCTDPRYLRLLHRRVHRDEDGLHSRPFRSGLFTQRDL